MPPPLHTTHRRIAAEMLGDAVRRGEAGDLAVTGRCMAPLLRDGDRVHVEAYGHGEAPRRGDLVLAHGADGGLVCHRVLERSGADWLLAGDRSFGLERHASEWIVGRVTRALRGAGPHRRTLAFDGWLQRLGPALAAWHGVARRSHGRAWARGVEWPRLAVVYALGRLAWATARR